MWQRGSHRVAFCFVAIGSVDNQKIPILILSCFVPSCSVTQSSAISLMSCPAKDPDSHNMVIPNWAKANEQGLI